MLMNKNLQKQQTGAVSMITVIFVSVILSVLTTSFIRLTINEQREAIDDDLTTRAYYAAESGVQDAITAIKNNSVDAARAAECRPNSGDGVLSNFDGLDTAYTCQTIALAPVDYQASLSEGEAVFFKLDSGADNISSLKISWHILGDSNDSDGRNVVAHNSAILPQSGNWGDGSGNSFPAMLRTQLISVPEVNVTRSSINNYVGFLNPTNNAAAVTTPAGMNGGVSSAACNFGVSDGAYVCSITIGSLNDSANDYYLRVQALYRTTHVKIEIFAGGSLVKLVDVQAVIDVTGRAGDVYRRVEERVDLTPNSLWPNYAILSAEDICKNFVITDKVVHATDPDFDFANPSIEGSCRLN